MAQYYRYYTHQLRGVDAEYEPVNRMPQDEESMWQYYFCILKELFWIKVIHLFSPLISIPQA